MTDLLVTNAQLLDPAAGELRGGASIRVEGDRLVEVGRPGAYADFLLVDGDPLSDISLLAGRGEHLDLIVRAGEVVVNRLR